MSENSKFNIASHIVQWVFIIGIGGWLIYAATHTKTNIKNQDFATGSTQTNNYHTIKNYALASLQLALTPFEIHGCVRADKMEQQPTETKAEPLDVTQTNAIISDSKP